MNNKKTSSNQLVSIVILFVASLLVGAGLGNVLESLGFPDRISKLPPSGQLWVLILGLLALLLAMPLSIALHEGGHLVCGLCSHYQFVSYRIGSHLWMRQDGKLVHRRFSLAGTGGQCLMMPPEPDATGRYPQALYNMGGSLANLLETLLFFLLCLLLRPHLYASLAMFVVAALGFFLALTNGIPLNLGQVPNDGWNAIHIGRDPAALRAFWVTLVVNARQHQGAKLRDLPEAWFEMPSEADLRNGIVATQGVFAENRAMDRHDFPLAQTYIRQLLAETAGTAAIYRNLLVCDDVYCALLQQGPAADLTEYTSKKQQSFMQQMKRFPSVIRTQYAVALLYDQNPSKAHTLRATFQKVAENYPAPAEIASEQELFDLVDRRAGTP